VRFHQSRLVHDFIYQGVLSVLQQQSENQLLQEEASAEATQERWQPENRVASGRNQFSTPAPASGTARDSTSRASGGAQRQPLWPNAGPGYQKQQGALYRELLDTPTAPPAANRAEEPSALEGHSQSFGRVLTVIQPEYALLEREGKLMLLSLSVADRWLKQAQLIPGSEGVRAQPLLIPVRMKVSKEELEVLLRYQPLLLNMGVEFAAEAKQIVIRTVPLPLRKQNLQILIHELPGYLAQQAEIDATQIAHWFARHLTSEHEQWNQAQAIALLADVERLCPQLVRNPPGGLLQPVDLTLAMNALKDD